MIPKTIIFDLDFTLWYPEMYELAGAPFKKTKNGIFDSRGEQVFLFPDVESILSRIKSEFPDILIAVASKTTYPNWAKSCLELFDIGNGSLNSIINYSHIYPKNKQIHLQKIKQESGIEYEDMLFFDNEVWNLRDVEHLGVTCVHTPNGLSMKDFELGLKMHRQKFD